MRSLVYAILLVVLALPAPVAQASRTLAEIARLKGQGASTVQGLGLVVGLDGTGDSLAELAVARPLAEVYRRLGNPISIDELGSGKSVALVLVTCEIPREGSLTDDRLDVTVSVLNSAKSIRGGTLLVSPLTPGPGAPVYAMARGELSIPDDSNPTSARVIKGAQIVRDVITTPAIASGFDLIIDPRFALGGASARVASDINEQYLLTSDPNERPIARAVDARTVRVTVPLPERTNPQAFLGDILRTDISSALRELPAQVICDTRTGIIVITGDVQVSPAVITHRDLSISTVLPPLPANIQQTVQSEFAKFGTDADEATLSRLDDLIAAFDQLDIPPVDQINILRALRDAGKLHARLIIDGKE
jgi:flagellar P-ring protein FlgI